jgi:hypothetical protein
VSKSRSEVVAAAIVGALALATLVSGCDGDVCVRESDCTSGLVCRSGHCIVANDAGDAAAADAAAPHDAAPASDTGPRADVGPHDAAAAADAAIDASVDASTVDVGHDAM